MVALNVEVDCAEFAPWQAASAACEAARQGRSAPETLLLLVAARLPPEQRFHFMELEFSPRRELLQSELHGLLGQRALGTAAAGVTARGAIDLETGFGSQGEGAIEGVYTDYIMGALGEHGGTRFTMNFGHCVRYSEE